MSMHLRGSRDMMGRDESWWQSRTGLEQKLVILSTLLFILSFSLTISVIVIKNRTPSCGGDATTISPTEVTGDVTTVSGETPSSEPSVTVTEPTVPPTVSESTVSVTESETPTEKQTSAPTSEVASSPTSEAASSPTSEVASSTTVATTPDKKPGPEPKSGSINSRPARYIPSPRGLANMHGEVLGA